MVLTVHGTSLVVHRSVAFLHTGFSSLGVDVWDHGDYGFTAEQARQSVLAQHGDVLGLFDEVHFTSSGNRSLVNRHVKTSFSYYNIWSATFGPEREATKSNEGEGFFGVPIPTVIASMDARTEVPENIDLAAITELLDRGSSEQDDSALWESSGDRESQRARAQSIWVKGEADERECDPHCGVETSRPIFVDVDAHEHPFPQCINGSTFEEGRSAFRYTCPSELDDVKPAWKADLPAGAVGDWCTGHAKPIYGEMLAGAHSGLLHRGPFCPSTRFFLLHRRTLPLVHDAMKLWRDAYDAQKWGELTSRFEYTTCSLLGVKEAVLSLKYNEGFNPREPASPSLPPLSPPPPGTVA